MVVIEENYLIRKIHLNNGEVYKNYINYLEDKHLSEKDYRKFFEDINNTRNTIDVNTGFNFYLIEKEGKELFLPGIKLYMRFFEKNIHADEVGEEKEEIEETLIKFIPFSSIYLIEFMSIDELSDRKKKLIDIEEDKEPEDFLPNDGSFL